MIFLAFMNLIAAFVTKFYSWYSTGPIVGQYCTYHDWGKDGD